MPMTIANLNDRTKGDRLAILGGIWAIINLLTFLLLLPILIAGISEESKGHQNASQLTISSIQASVL